MCVQLLSNHEYFKCIMCDHFTASTRKADGEMFTKCDLTGQPTAYNSVGCIAWHSEEHIACDCPEASYIGPMVCQTCERRDGVW